jgi:fumarate hydratase class II
MRAQVSDALLPRAARAVIRGRSYPIVQSATLIIFNNVQSITILTDGCTNFRKFLVEGTRPNLKKINEYVERSLMLVTALSPVIGYDKASKVAHYAMDNDLTLKAAALQLGFVTETQFDRIVDPGKMVKPYVAGHE